MGPACWCSSRPASTLTALPGACLSMGAAAASGSWSRLSVYLQPVRPPSLQRRASSLRAVRWMLLRAEHASGVGAGKRLLRRRQDRAPERGRKVSDRACMSQQTPFMRSSCEARPDGLSPGADGGRAHSAGLMISSRWPAPAARTSDTASPAAGARIGRRRRLGVVAALGGDRRRGRWAIARTGRIDALKSSAIGSPGTR